MKTKQTTTAAQHLVLLFYYNLDKFALNKEIFVPGLPRWGKFVLVCFCLWSWKTIPELFLVKVYFWSLFLDQSAFKSHSLGAGMCDAGTGIRWSNRKRDWEVLGSFPVNNQFFLMRTCRSNFFGVRKSRKTNVHREKIDFAAKPV